MGFNIFDDAIFGDNQQFDVEVSLPIETLFTTRIKEVFAFTTRVKDAFSFTTRVKDAVSFTTRIG